MARSLRRTLMVSGAAVAIGALAAIGMTSASAGTGGIGILADRTVRTGIDIPWGITFLPDRSAYVAERDTGRILRITQSGARSVVGTVPGTAFGGEGGLLGLAVAPGFNPADGRLFAYQTVSSGNRIVRALAADGLDVAEGTVCGALRAVADLLVPLEEAIVARNAEARHAHADET